MRLDSGQIEIVEEPMVEILHLREPWERIEIGFGLWTGAREMLTNHLASTHPDWTEEQIRREVVRRMSHGAA